MAKLTEIARASYTYQGDDQKMSLPFAESAVILIVERADDGWCRGFARGKQGWFPASYVKTISKAELTKVSIFTIILENCSIIYIIYIYDYEITYG